MEIQSTGTFTRRSASLAFNEAIKDAIFSSAPDQLVGPLDSDDGVVVIKIIKRGPESEDEAAETKSLLRLQLLREKRDTAYEAVMNRVQDSASIELDEVLLASWRRDTARR